MLLLQTARVQPQALAIRLESPWRLQAAISSWLTRATIASASLILLALSKRLPVAEMALLMVRERQRAFQTPSELPQFHRAA
jgi:hypothetical protein